MTAIGESAVEGVSAAAWTLHERGMEAERSDGVIRDPLAVALLDRTHYDYDGSAQSPGPWAERLQARAESTWHSVDLPSVADIGRPAGILPRFG